MRHETPSIARPSSAPLLLRTRSLLNAKIVVQYAYTYSFLFVLPLPLDARRCRAARDIPDTKRRRALDRRVTSRVEEGTLRERRHAREYEYFVHIYLPYFCSRCFLPGETSRTLRHLKVRHYPRRTLDYQAIESTLPDGLQNSSP
ncbi:hypothetical protein PENSPDRAFT_511610 [Peniophora sp. CONT]|nr:hypothetical protein PENSPDRAFT_511610 [Peniophora sp. CONT]